MSEKIWYEVRTTLDDDNIDKTLERFDTLAEAKKFAELETKKWGIEKLVLYTNKYGHESVHIATYSGDFLGWAANPFYTQLLRLDVEV